MASKCSITGRFVSETVEFDSLITEMESDSDGFVRVDHGEQPFSMGRTAFESLREDIETGCRSTWHCVGCGVDANDFGEGVSERRDRGERERWVRLLIDDRHPVTGNGHVGVCETCLRRYAQ